MHVGVALRIIITNAVLSHLHPFSSSDVDFFVFFLLYFLATPFLSRASAVFRHAATFCAATLLTFICSQPPLRGCNVALPNAAYFFPYLNKRSPTRTVPSSSFCFASLFYTSRTPLLAPPVRLASFIPCATHLFVVLPFHLALHRNYVRLLLPFSYYPFFPLCTSTVPLLPSSSNCSSASIMRVSALNICPSLQYSIPNNSVLKLGLGSSPNFVVFWVW